MAFLGPQEKLPILSQEEAQFQHGFVIPPVSSLFHGGLLWASRRGFKKILLFDFPLLHRNVFYADIFCPKLSSFLYPSTLPLTFHPGFSAPTSAPSQGVAAGTKPRVALDPHIRLKDGKLDLVSGLFSFPPSGCSPSGLLALFLPWKSCGANKEGQEEGTGEQCAVCSPDEGPGGLCASRGGCLLGCDCPCCGCAPTKRPPGVSLVEQHPQAARGAGSRWRPEPGAGRDLSTCPSGSLERGRAAPGISIGVTGSLAFRRDYKVQN